MTQETKLPHYDELIRHEAQFWGNAGPQPDNPQLWEDPALSGIFHEPNRRRTVERVSNVGGTVLELGCGNGDMAIELALRGMRVEAIDLSEERIRRAREKTRTVFERSPSPPPVFRVEDLNTLSLSPNRYDCVVAFDALHHIYSLQELMQSVYHALRPGGWIVVHDYVGMGPIRKLVAATLYAILPTYKSYHDKAMLVRRLPHFLAGEKGKRKRLLQLSPERFEQSPFEEVSLGSIEEAIGKRFHIIERSYDHPFFFYLAAKIRIPRAIRLSFGKVLHSLDTLLVRSRICKGAYVFIVARKEG